MAKFVPVPVEIVPHPIEGKVVFDVMLGENVVEGGYSHPSIEHAQIWAKEQGYSYDAQS